LIQVQKIRFELPHQRHEIRGGVFEVLFGSVHPLQAEGSWTVFQTLQFIHPGGLLGQGNITEANQCHSYSATYQPGNQFLRVGPHSAQRIGGNKNVHKISNARASVSHRVARTYSISEWLQIEAILFESGRTFTLRVQHFAPAASD
jgi:hypothetical protein